MDVPRALYGGESAEVIKYRGGTHGGSGNPTGGCAGRGVWRMVHVLAVLGAVRANVTSTERGVCDAPRANRTAYSAGVSVVGLGGR